MLTCVPLILIPPASLFFRFDGPGGDYWRLQINKNDNGSNDAATERGYQSGIHTIRGQAPSSPFSLGVNGFMRLKKGDTIWQVFFAATGVERGHENGFSAALVHTLV